MPPAVGTTHDVRIGSDHFIVRPGGYTKQTAPQFGSRFTTGDPDFNNLSFWQHWVQRCWVGGFGADTWRDDAMFDEGVGVDTTQHEVMTLARDLGPADRVTGNWDLNGEAQIRIFVVSPSNGKLYALQTGGTGSTSRFYRFDEGTATWTLLKTWTDRIVEWVEPFGGYLVFGCTGSTLSIMDGVETFNDTIAKPAGRTSPVRMLKTYRGRLYVGLGREIWRLKADFTWDGATPFYTAEDVNYFNQSEVYLGQLYFASRNGHILRTDGNNTFDLWAFEAHVSIWGLRAFDGRLFVGAAEEHAGTTSSQTVLYQFSGAAVTELKRWGRVGKDTTPGKLRAFGQSLWFGASNLLGMGDGFGIARYDPVEDAYHLWSSNQDGVTYPMGAEGVLHSVDDVFFFKGFMYCSVRGYGIFRTPYTFQDASRGLATYDNSAAGGSIGSQNGGWYISSDFDAGTPGLLKLWNAVTVHVDLPNIATSAYLEYSLDGGATWVEGGSVTKDSAATRYAKTFMLGAGTPVRATRFKYRVTLRTTNTAYSPQLRSVVVRYVPIPEPGWLWDLRLVLAEKIEQRDGQTETVDVAAVLTRLQGAYRSGTLVEFQDIDGTVWAGANQPGALITSMEVKPAVLTATSQGVREYDVRVVLLEAVEGY